MEDDRRDPDVFLSRAREEEADRERGRLKIFFGAVAGVGKTYSMLETARKLKKDGLDVLVGYVETHGRADTEALLEGLEILPRVEYLHRGAKLQEFDLDAVLKRKPDIVLVDELAHSNVPGSRHTKRWQDIEELLNAGIDVFTTLNVQHIESVNDVVEHITMVPIRERVPDSFLERASDFELIDLPPDELIARMKEGKVYFPEQARGALENFFRKGNLIALREMALRITADRVDAQMDQYRRSHSIKEPWPTTDRILVCISSSPLSVKLVRAAKRMAGQMKSKWTCVYVETPSQLELSAVDKDRVIQTLRLAEQLGAETTKLSGNRVSEELVRFARQTNVAKIIIGKPARPRWREILFGSVVDELIRLSGVIDVYVITGDQSSLPTGVRVRRPVSRPSGYFIGALIVAVVTSAGRLVFDYISITNVAMVYMLGVVIVAIKCGRGPAIFASILSVAAFDFFFVPPVFTFAVTDTEYIVTFIVMLTVALVISTLTARVKQQAESAYLRERRTASLYSMSRDLSSTIDLSDLVQAGLKHMADEFDSKVAILFPNETGNLAVYAVGSGTQALTDLDEGVAQWAFKNGQVAGICTNTLPAAKAIYAPLNGSKSAIGVIAVCPASAERFYAPDQLHLLETFSNQMAIACERAFLSNENEKNRLQMRTDQLRSSLLKCVSHDLRTPLATIAGAASSIVEGSSSITVESCKSMAREIYAESARLTRLVKNLLDMTRVQSGTLSLNKELIPIDDLIGSALSAVENQLAGRPVKIDISPDLPMVSVDPVLIQQVFVNLLENAIKYTPAQSEIEITACVSNNNMEIDFADNGPGIGKANMELIFREFYQERSEMSSGVGLGLAICRGICEAHGAKLIAENRNTGGALFRFILPLEKIESGLAPLEAS